MQRREIFKIVSDKMTFVRTVKTTSKTEKHYEYLRIVESYREKEKHKQRVIVNFGKSSVCARNLTPIPVKPTYTQRRILNTLKILPPLPDNYAYEMKI